MRKTLQKSKRIELINKWNSNCSYCGIGINAQTAQIDHGIPLVLQDSISLLGLSAQLPSADLNDDWNLFPSCRKCNNWKGGMTIKQFRFELSKQVERCRRYSRNYRIASRFGLVVAMKNSVDFYMDHKVGMGVTEFDQYEAIKRHSITNVPK
jgi:hypothetical protein